MERVIRSMGRIALLGLAGMGIVIGASYSDGHADSYLTSTLTPPGAASPPPFPVSTTHTPSDAIQAKVSEYYGKLPLSFEANQGQTDPQVKFFSRGQGYSLFLTPTEAVLGLRKSAQQPPSSDIQATSTAETSLRIRLLGASETPKITGLEPLPGRSHYLTGNNPRQWRTDVPRYAKVHYQEVYPRH